MQETHKGDQFLRGPLAEADLVDPAARERYIRVSLGKREERSDDDGDEGPKDELPARVLLRRSDELPGLFDYQQDLVDQILEVALRPPPSNTALLALPTGAGKTRTAIYAVLGLLAKERVSQVLWLAPGRELLDQAFETFRKLWWNYRPAPSVELFRCHVLGGLPRVVSGAGMYFATPHMLSSRVSKEPHKLPQFDVVIFDEAHQAAAPVFREVFRRVRMKDGQLVPAIGLSATPGRSHEMSTESLVELFGRRLLTSRYLRPNAIEVLESRGVLAKLDFIRIPIERRTLGQRQVIKSRADLARPVKPLELDSGRFHAIIETVANLPSDERTLVFAGSIAHANALWAVLVDRCRASVVSSNTPLVERGRILDDFQKGKISVLLNKSILAMGYDCPAVSNVVLTMPIGSSILFEQIVGRASRGPATGGTAQSKIWQLDDHLAIHGYPKSYYRYRDFDWSS